MKSDKGTWAENDVDKMATMKISRNNGSSFFTMPGILMPFPSENRVIILLFINIVPIHIISSTNAYCTETKTNTIITLILFMP
jgi:hypothetical protein